jgi:hypothetical protein
MFSVKAIPDAVRPRRTCRPLPHPAIPHAKRTVAPPQSGEVLLSNVDIAYLFVTILAAAANVYAASNDFRSLAWVQANMGRLGIPSHWLMTLGSLKMAGGLGLLLGIHFRWIGVAAGAGLVLFFVGAIVTTIRARWYTHLPFPIVWLVLAAGALGLRVALP